LPVYAVFLVTHVFNPPPVGSGGAILTPVFVQMRECSAQWNSRQ
jgi:hypothetical protein